MNAHQRRIERRKPTFLFDMESWPMGDFFDFASIRPTGRTLTAVAPDIWYARPLSGQANGIEPLSHTIKILKERPAGGPLMLDMDFTKLEERIMDLTTQVRSGAIDCHRQKASEMFNVAYDDVTPEQRAKGKDANYINWYRP